MEWHYIPAFVIMGLLAIPLLIVPCCFIAFVLGGIFTGIADLLKCVLDLVPERQPPPPKPKPEPKQKPKPYSGGRSRRYGPTTAHQL